MNAGESEVLYYTISPENASNQDVTWASSDDTIVTVTQGGEVTGVSEGTATVTATTEDGDFSVPYTVNVTGCAILFDGGGARGAMDSIPITLGESYELPTCTFIAPDGKEFAGWKVAEDSELKAPGDSITPTASVIVTAIWRNLPTFNGQALVLSGKIGVNFYLDLSTLSDDEKNASYMEFTVNGKTTSAKYDANKTTNGLFFFTCPVTSIQMAEPITAEFHYGHNGENTVTKTYSVKRYIEYFDSHQNDYDAATLALIQCISDYGHYVQPFLAEANGWTVGTTYAEMDKFYAASYDYDTVKAAVADKAFSASIDGSSVSKVTYRLVLDSDTAVDVFFALNEGHGDFSASTTFNGKSYQAVQESANQYRIRIPGISAHLLGNTITINGSCDGDFTVNVSALSYVRAVLNPDNHFNDTAKSAVSSLYYYNDAVLTCKQQANQ